MSLFRYALLLLMLAGSLSAASTVQKIETSKNKLAQQNKKQKELNRHLMRVADDIAEAKKANLKINEKLNVLGEEFRKNEATYQEYLKTLLGYDKQLSILNKEIRENNKQFINLLAQQFSVMHAMNQTHEPSPSTIIKQEVYRLYKDQNTRELTALKNKLDNFRTEKKKIVKERRRLKKSIDKLATQRNNYLNERKTKDQLLTKLEKDEDIYRNKLQDILDEQNEMRSTLARLNIIRAQEVDDERKRIQRQKEALLAEEKRKQIERRKLNTERDEAIQKGEKIVYNTKPMPDNTKTNIESSYTKNAVSDYSGGKTISPIAGAKLVKGFGTYIDPIYKIKIFNESITLKAPSNNDKVVTVLNGKVVYTSDSSMLGKVVVIAHNDNIHTIYAGLSKIAPGITKGTKVRKNSVIGKVTSKLIFEATKNSKHINPLKLISI